MAQYLKDRYVAVLCLLFGLLCMGTHGGWVLSTNLHPAPILPPAGQSLETEAPFTFAALGDTRGNISVFKKALRGAKRSGADLVLHTGDMAQRLTVEQYNWVLRGLREVNLSVPFCPVPGNHDVQHDEGERWPYALYSGAFGPRRYWFAYANTLFVGVDSSAEQVGTRGLKWLDEILTEHRRDFDACVVFMHVPLHDPRHDDDREIRSGKERMVDILQKHDVTAVIGGHNHGFAKGAIEGIPVYVHGGAGEELEPSESGHTYLLCSVDREGSLDVSLESFGRTENKSYVEYLMNVKFPSPALAVLGLFFAVAGAYMVGCRSRP